jgi:CDP-paratose 2-epimerase
MSDLRNLPHIDWIIDCAANPSVLAGIDSSSSSRQVLEHNLLGTINLLEYCKDTGCGLILLSTSRVYSANKLAGLAVDEKNNRFVFDESNECIGVSTKGINEAFPTTPPLSLYGSSKLASEIIILEYANSFDFPVWINRCGVLAGAGQFGKADQGIFSFWIHSFRERRQLNYIGFDGSGLQVRDALHPKDLTPLLWKQMNHPNSEKPKILNLGGGNENAMSLRQLSAWCDERFGSNEILCSTEERPADAPWIVMDCSLAKEAWNWETTTTTNEILNEIAMHAEKNPHWLNLCQ